MLLDHIIMCLIIVPPMIMLDEILKPYKHFDIVMFYVLSFVYLNKDFLNGESFAKRILGLSVIDLRTNKPASGFKCFLRNMTILIWPIEVFISLFSKNRRLGDYIANTKVEIVEKKPMSSMFKEIKSIRLKPGFFWTIIVGIIYVFIFDFVTELILLKLRS